MLLNNVRRFIARFTHAEASAASAESTSATITPFDFDPMWHGDHWQNLLSCPMDARHYVMEDWSVAASTAWDDGNHARAH